MLNGPRAQKTARATGARPGVLTQPEPQCGAVTVGYVAAPALFLSSAMLADAAAEAVDARTVKYLLKAALRRREEEEERKEWEMELARRDELQRGVTEALEKARAALEPSRGSKRKRKKRRKRRLPRSSVPRGGRARRRQRQWLAPGWFSWVFLQVSSASSASWSVWTRRILMQMVGFAGDSAPRAVFLSLSSGPRWSASWPVWTRGTVIWRESGSGMYKAGFLVFLHLALCLPRRRGKLNYLGDGVYFSITPCIWKSLVRAVCLRCTGLLISGR